MILRKTLPFYPIKEAIRDENATFAFPNKVPLEKKLRDCLELHVDDHYFLSDKIITCFSSMKNRNGLIRGLRFRPRGANDDYAWTITTCPGSRATDNFAIVPVKEALKDLPEGVEFHSGEDDMILLPQATKDGYAIAKKGDGVYIKRVQKTSLKFPVISLIGEDLICLIQIAERNVLDERGASSI